MKDVGNVKRNNQLKAINMFCSNNGKGDKIDIKNVHGVVDKDHPPTECYIDIISLQGRLRWKYLSEETRDKDSVELRKLRDEYRENL